MWFCTANESGGACVPEEQLSSKVTVRKRCVIAASADATLPEWCKNEEEIK